MRLHRRSDGRTSSPTTPSSRRAFVGRSVRCSRTVIRKYVCINTSRSSSCFLAHTPMIHISGYTRTPKLMLIYTRAFPVLPNFLLCFSILFIFGGRGRVIVCGISNGGMCAIEICKATLDVDFYVRCTYVRRYGLVRARKRTLLVSLRRCAIVSHACGWRPRPRQIRRWRRSGRPHSSCTA